MVGMVPGRAVRECNFGVVDYPKDEKPPLEEAVAPAGVAARKPVQPGGPLTSTVEQLAVAATARGKERKGKKAKRKAREKIIEEARRLALMQKKREMKAAGIDYIMTKRDKIRDRKWKKVMNYNKEIPFERQVQEFRYAHPKSENPIAGGDVGNISL